MYYTIALLAIGGFLTLLLAVWILARTRWFIGLVAGTLGLSILLLSAILVLATVRLFQYEPIESSALLGTLTLSMRESDEFEVSLTRNRNMDRYEVTGDSWRVRGTLLSIPAFLVFGERQDYFVVNRLEGRFRLLEQELNTERSEVAAPWYNRVADHALSLVFASESLHTPLLPLADEAIFTLEYRARALRLQAVNAPAQEAMERDR